MKATHKLCVSAILSIAIIGSASLVFVSKEATYVTSSANDAVQCTNLVYEHKHEGPPSEGIKSVQPPPVSSADIPTSALPDELFADENPGAVLYFRRVERAAQNKNTVLARELLRRLELHHPTSLLIVEAKALLGEKDKQ